MAIEDGSNADLLKLWKAGNQQAAQVLVDRYMLRLTALAQSRLSRLLARRLDADDIVLSAWRSFFVAANRSRLQVPDDDNLWPLLATFTLRKLQRQAQRQLADRRSMARELSMSDDDGWRELVSREPSSEDAAQLTYDIELLLTRLEPADRDIMMLRLQGNELETIAEKMTCSERTVRRAMQRIRTQLADYLGASNNLPEPLPQMTARVADDKDASSLKARHQPAPTPSIRYQDLKLDAMIGRGGFGRVFRARWITRGMTVAVKYLNKRFWKHEITARALIEESQRAQQIDHPNIIRHYGWGRAPSGAPFLVMDLVQGPNLRDSLRDNSVAAAEIHSCAIQICDGLIALHRAGILHGDISPGNVLRRAPHDFVLTDFGFSRSAHDANPARGGTPGFLAPEQFSSAFGTISERTDVYGFGALLYFLAIRRAPFEGDSEPDVAHQVLSSRGPASISADFGTLSALVPTIMKCLSKLPSERPATMELVRRSIAEHVSLR